MADPVAGLAAGAATDGLGLPRAAGACRLAPQGPEARVAIAPFRGRDAAVAARLEASFGAALPAPGRTAAGRAGRFVWMGLGQWLAETDPATAAALAAELGGDAAIADQSDAWAGFALDGAAAAEVLARLVPIDLDPAAFPPGSVARTPLRHLACALIRTEAAFEILVMRSFAATAVHDLATAMRSVAARAALD